MSDEASSQSSYPVASTVVTAAAILEYIGEKGRALPQELARDLKLNRATVHRTLFTLTQLGYTARQVDGSHRLTFHVFELGISVLHSRNLIDSSRAALLELSEKTGYTVNHGVLYDNRVLYIDKISPQSFLQLDKAVGESDPLHCTSLGKALLAALSDEERAKIVSELDLERCTPNTITDARALLRNLDEVRERGYSIDNQEVAMELRCIGAPVIGADGTAVSALSISGPADRLSAADIPDLAKALRKTLDQIEARLRTAHAS